MSAETSLSLEYTCLSNLELVLQRIALSMLELAASNLNTEAEYWSTTMKIITVFHVPFAFDTRHRFSLYQKESAQNGDSYIMTRIVCALHLIIPYEFVTCFFKTYERQIVFVAPNPRVIRKINILKKWLTGGMEHATCVEKWEISTKLDTAHFNWRNYFGAGQNWRALLRRILGK